MFRNNQKNPFDTFGYTNFWKDKMNSQPPMINEIPVIEGDIMLGELEKAKEMLSKEQGFGTPEARSVPQYPSKYENQMNNPNLDIEERVKAIQSFYNEERLRNEQTMINESQQRRDEGKKRLEASNGYTTYDKYGMDGFDWDIKHMTIDGFDPVQIEKLKNERHSNDAINYFLRTGALKRKQAQEPIQQYKQSVQPAQSYNEPQAQQINYIPRQGETDLNKYTSQRDEQDQLVDYGVDPYSKENIAMAAYETGASPTPYVNPLAGYPGYYQYQNKFRK